MEKDVVAVVNNCKTVGLYNDVVLKEYTVNAQPDGYKYEVS
jgi:hypothetical protein